MIQVTDFSKCPLSSRDLEYGGRAGEKRGIIYNDDFWFLKFPKSTNGMNNIQNLSYVTSPLNEFIGSNIFKILGYHVHETKLGICFDGRKYKVVCACKDFIKDDKNEILIPYTALRNDTNPKIMKEKQSSSSSASNINEIIFQLNYNTILSNIPHAKERFWDMVIIDVLINNNDRNEDNWGVIKFKNTNHYELAPIYDCGNCFYGKTSEKRIKDILSNKERLISSALNGITAYEDNHENPINNKQILRIDNGELKKAIIRIRKLIDEKLDEIVHFINSIPKSFKKIEIMSEARKKYYIATLKLRIDKLLNDDIIF